MVTVLVCVVTGAALQGAAVYSMQIISAAEEENLRQETSLDPVSDEDLSCLRQTDANWF